MYYKIRNPPRNALALPLWSRRVINVHTNKTFDSSIQGKLLALPSPTLNSRLRDRTAEIPESVIRKRFWNVHGKRPLAASSDVEIPAGSMVAQQVSWNTFERRFTYNSRPCLEWLLEKT
ncbi:predicted protein [Coccidioides posadasii str. Silveira]|uniref:Predicted protein n=1 Tax=Coccidioides posadasii (strain RMSCC 757 / Silveira) TaxID=443226 RepID=E9D2P5_COCPS|nr:predicted protein [Coccidioides posadasii str. Silveira]